MFVEGCYCQNQIIMQQWLVTLWGLSGIQCGNFWYTVGGGEDLSVEFWAQLELQRRRWLWTGSCHCTLEKEGALTCGVSPHAVSPLEFPWAHLSPTREVCYLLKVLWGSTNSPIWENCHPSVTGIWFQLKWEEEEEKRTIFVYKIQHVSWHSLHDRNLMIGGVFSPFKKVPKMLLQCKWFYTVPIDSLKSI